MGKFWRGNLSTSCKMAGGLGEEKICKAKIKLIFKGAPSDMFINDFMSLSKREQELIAMTLMILFKYDFSFKYFQFFKKINKRVLLFGIINFFRIGY